MYIQNTRLLFSLCRFLCNRWFAQKCGLNIKSLEQMYQSVGMDVTHVLRGNPSFARMWYSVKCSMTAFSKTSSLLKRIIHAIWYDRFSLIIVGCPLYLTCIEISSVDCRSGICNQSHTLPMHLSEKGRRMLGDHLIVECVENYIANTNRGITCCLTPLRDRGYIAGHYVHALCFHNGWYDLTFHIFLSQQLSIPKDSDTSYMLC